jgi:chemotaxis regulatin CheY-phosphate phosphatase CheZ
MEDSKRELIEETKRFWQARTGKPISDEDAREMIENITGFFKILIEWDKKAKNQPSSPE